MGYVSTRHQNSKIGMTTYYSRSPSLHLKGDWLAEAGFDTGTSVTVKISEGCPLIRDYTDLEILAETEQGDAYLFASKDKRIAFVTGHPEYDAQTLAQEYFRDVEAGLNPDVPYNYFPHIPS